MPFSLEVLKDPEQLLAIALPMAMNVVAALAIFFIGKWVANLVVGMIRKAMIRGKMDETLASFLGNVLYGLLLAIIVIAALGQLGVDTTSAAAVIGGASLAIGLSLQGQLASFAAGVMLIMFRPFKKGDFIEAGGQSGSVQEIRIFATIMTTGDNREVIVPNSSIWGGSITNFSARPTRRIDLVIGVSYDADLKQARDVLTQVIEAESRILKEPAVTIAVSELADSSVNFVVRPWVNSGDYWPTRFALTEAIKNALDEAGIGIPYPQMDVHLQKSAD